MTYVVLRDNGYEGMQLLRAFDRHSEMVLYVTGYEAAYSTPAVFECNGNVTVEPRRLQPEEWRQ